MTAATTTSGAKRTSRCEDPIFDFGGARIRAHCRHLATVVTIQGEIDAANVDRVSEYVRRFALTNNSLVLDLSGVDYFAAAAVTLLYTLDEDYRAAGLEWALVPSHSVNGQLRACDSDAMFPITPSVHQALHEFAELIAARRQLLLPLIRKTA